MELLQDLIKVSEKAANVARLCRQEQHLFELLIEKKCGSDANPRFIDDFKTLADVLIQELVKNDIGKKFPEFNGRIFGEENNVFSNKLGETIQVEIKDSHEETSNLLRKVLNQDDKAADLLAEELHKTISLDCVNTKLPETDFSIDFNNLSIWIDPIDSTTEYINAIEKIDSSGISITGLSCVTVLIGVFNKKTGIPIFGVVNQPFFQFEERWSGICYWATPDTSSLTSFQASTKIICVSSSENSSILEKLEKAGYKIVEASGAGYKILAVITGKADAYILSKKTTFKWDTCGPQAILRSLGGDIVNFSGDSITYKNDNKEALCNSGGIIAFRNRNILTDIINLVNDLF